jgi:CheY-like chemotaxis protein
VTVDDTGRGIAPELLDRLFEPFVTDKPGGMGLGLAICHGIVASLGGSIAASRLAPRGTRFEVRLPALRGDGAASEAPPRPEPAQRAPESGRVLVVDDEERLAETIRMALSPPHRVDVCTKSREVLRWIEEGRDYDVVLCDLMMPDLSGPELYDRVKAVRPELAARFVFLTGGAFTPRTREFLHAVPNRRLEKPFELEALEQLVKDALAARP